MEQGDIRAEEERHEILVRGTARWFGTAVFIGDKATCVAAARIYFGKTADGGQTGIRQVAVRPGPEDAPALDASELVRRAREMEQT